MTNLTLTRPDLQISDSFSPPPDRARKLAKIFTFTFAAGVTGLLFLEWNDKVFLSNCQRIIQSAPQGIQSTCGSGLLANPYFFVSLLICFALEKFLPARKGDGTFSRHSYFDAQWIVPKFIFFGTFWLLYLALLRGVYNQYFSFLTIHQVESWPWLAKFALGFLVVDFLRYFSHLLRHRVETFWTFHAVHHSQKNLNFFTDYRNHFFDDILKYTLEAIPMFMLDQSFVQILFLDQLMYWYSAVYHGNIRSNFGWLRYILVTPQSHRVHHSIEPRHRDTNFGVILSVWDHIFGTQHRNYDEYPATGIDDPHFPYEESQSPKNYFKTFFEQFFYPFKLPRFLSFERR